MRNWMFISTVTTNHDHYVVTMHFYTQEERDERFAQIRPEPNQILQKFRWTENGWVEG